MSGYSKPLPKKSAETEVLLPEILQAAPTIDESQSQDVVTPKLVKESTIPIATITEELEEINSKPEIITTGKTPLAVTETDK